MLLDPKELPAQQGGAEPMQGLHGRLQLLFWDQSQRRPWPFVPSLHSQESSSTPRLWDAVKMAKVLDRPWRCQPDRSLQGEPRSGCGVQRAFPVKSGCGSQISSCFFTESSRGHSLYCAIIFGCDLLLLLQTDNCLHDAEMGPAPEQSPLLGN
ncbi:hypothetical protein MG293_017041 [Ovis ammon polii]|uniref:Uncharacterized protein n=1 Tax=Ovis ammon polii TaxID=230172 RepID=A0AAD4Y2W9_OVIAM|nr:hypothetical protein MG293_017041 [Ovis ammon polii]